MNQPRHQRRTVEQWQTIINTFSTSGLSGTQFCKQQDIKYASFSKWRKRLSEAEDTLKPGLPESFLDISALSNGNSGHWNITLKLGNGVELILSQH